MMQFSLRFWSWYLHQPKKYYDDSLNQIFYTRLKTGSVTANAHFQLPSNRLTNDLNNWEMYNFIG